VLEHERQRTEDLQLRLADAVTRFAGSMPFVWVHTAAFAVWMVWLEEPPWPSLTLTVSLEAIFLSAFVLIGQNRQAAFARAKADHDFLAQQEELRVNTVLTRALYRHLGVTDGPGAPGAEEDPRARGGLTLGPETPDDPSAPSVTHPGEVGAVRGPQTSTRAGGPS